LRELLSHGPALLASTSELERAVFVVGGKPVPVIVNDGSEADCYLLSPHAHYVKYMLIELRKIEGMRSRVLGGAVDLIGRLSLLLGFNRCVSVNNWLFTTNPALHLTASEIANLTRALVRRYPSYPIVLRTIDAREPATRELFEAAGYRLVINRPVHEWEASRLKGNHRHNVRKELRLLDDPRFEVRVNARLEAGDDEAIHRLYSALYVEKHVGYNCRFTARFFRVVHDTGMMKFTTFRHAGRIVGFYSWFVDGGKLIWALVGRDIKLDVHEFPLYRMSAAEAFRAAMEQRRPLFLSTGSAQFKLQRGSFEWMEHEAVYDRHLPPHRRLPWATFQALLDAGTRNLNTSQI
jgi:hypothetical protein